ncbi:putative phage abortive infection protein [Rufibacter immobilis]|nr:putative phage abortive infection protein [Rufibacter immobilis]
MANEKKHLEIDWAYIWSVDFLFDAMKVATFVIGVLLLFLSIFLIPIYLIDQPVFVDKFQNTGVVGDTFGGLTAPIIAFIGAILTFFAFYVQYEANQAQNLNFKIQQFEGIFFEMVRLHRDNVAEIEVNGKRARNAFVELKKDFNFLYRTIKGVDKNAYIIEPIKRIEATYLFFYLGLNYNKEVLEHHLNKIVGEINYYDDAFGKNVSFSKTLISYLPYDVAKQNEIDKEWAEDDFYRPSHRIGLQDQSGFQSQLGHYFRHLFQTVKFVHNSDFLTPNQKYNYVKTLRAQLSTYEQALLFYNSVSTFGKKWELEPEDEHSKLISTYHLIKNLPLKGFTEDIQPDEIYPKVDYELK